MCAKTLDGDADGVAPLASRAERRRRSVWLVREDAGWGRGQRGAVGFES
ncbi:hypothetical protein PSMK_13930 [Phycisphaera mikurensis NBRC 102666]|uniref:Uncharacterized protein n=1 Tax=Phycisphaera mikurensis (strain NBRC 102666 / KCTC 22515 / FYK2301M01) TaxID=1142394 RepID=I0IE64_PHYMF|nr:hypothetical protein PSMK_13930 [Phycisphaera mikurensis NBRC 102666]